MGIAAWEVWKLTGDNWSLEQAEYWGTLEPCTPWVEKDIAFFYQAEDCIRVLVRSRGLGDVYKRQASHPG